MTSSDPQPPVRPGGPTPPSTQEIPVVQPATGGTATQQLPPNANAPALVPATAGVTPTGPVDFVPGLPGLGTPPPPPPTRPAPPSAAHQGADASSAAPAPVWPETLDSDAPPGERATRPRARRPGDRAALLGLALVALAVVLLELGLSLDFGGASSWSTVPLWSAFATACAVLVLVACAAFMPAGDRHRSGPARRVAAGGLAGLAVFWLLVVIPVADTDRGFVLTAALAAYGGALWTGLRRKD